MSYTTVAKVEGAMSASFDISGDPSIETVRNAIDNVSAELDAHLQAAGYTTPVTATEPLKMLEHICTMCVAEFGWHAGWVSLQLAPRAEYWGKQCDAFKAGLKDGSIELPGLTPEGANNPLFESVQFPNRSDYWRSREEETDNGG